MRSSLLQNIQKHFHVSIQFKLYQRHYHGSYSCLYFRLILRNTSVIMQKETFLLTLISQTHSSVIYAKIMTSMAVTKDVSALCTTDPLSIY